METKQGKEAKILAEHSASDVISFVHEWCIEGKGDHTEKQMLYRVYRRWVIATGSNRLGRNEFYREFTSAFPACESVQGSPKRKSRVSKLAPHRWVFKNIKIRSEYKTS